MVRITELAHVAGAVVAQRPDRHQQFFRNAEVPLDARHERGVALHQLSGAIDARGNDAGRGVFLEAFAESAALAAVEIEHRGIARHAGKGLVGHRSSHHDRLRSASYGGREWVRM